MDSSRHGMNVEGSAVSHSEDLSLVAERVGFEPTVRGTHRTAACRKSRFDSATLAPLRLNNKLCLSKEVEKKAGLLKRSYRLDERFGRLSLPPPRS